MLAIAQYAKGSDSPERWYKMTVKPECQTVLELRTVLLTKKVFPTRPLYYPAQSPHFTRAVSPAPRYLKSSSPPKFSHTNPKAEYLAKKYFSRIMKSEVDKPSFVRDFFRVMPKGGNLHFHLTGEMSRDCFRAAAIRHDLYFHKETMMFIPTRDYLELSSASRENYASANGSLAVGKDDSLAKFSNAVTVRENSRMACAERRDKFFGAGGYTKSSASSKRGVFEVISSITKHMSLSEKLGEVIERSERAGIGYCEPMITIEPDFSSSSFENFRSKFIVPASAEWLLTLSQTNKNGEKHFLIDTLFELVKKGADFNQSVLDLFGFITSVGKTKKSRKTVFFGREELLNKLMEGLLGKGSQRKRKEIIAEIVWEYNLSLMKEAMEAYVEETAAKIAKASEDVAVNTLERSGGSITDASGPLIGDGKRIVVRYIMEVNRELPLHFYFAQFACALSLQYKGVGVVGVNTVGSEDHYAARALFADQLQIQSFLVKHFTKEKGREPNVLTHLAENPSTPSSLLGTRVSHVFDTTPCLRRIGHLTAVQRGEVDEELVEKMRRVAVEICYTSSRVLCGGSPPVKYFLSQKIPVVLGTDDLQIFGGGALSDEYVKVAKDGVNLSDLQEMAENAVRHALIEGEGIYDEGGNIKEMFLNAKGQLIDLKKLEDSAKMLKSSAKEQVQNIRKFINENPRAFVQYRHLLESLYFTHQVAEAQESYQRELKGKKEHNLDLSIR